MTEEQQKFIIKGFKDGNIWYDSELYSFSCSCSISCNLCIMKPSETEGCLNKFKDEIIILVPEYLI